MHNMHAVHLSGIGTMRLLLLFFFSKLGFDLKDVVFKQKSRSLLRKATTHAKNLL